MLIKVLLLLTAHWQCALAVIYINTDIEICVHFVSCTIAILRNMHKSLQQQQQQQINRLHLCVVCVVGVSRSYNDSAAAKYNGCRRCRYVSCCFWLHSLLVFSFSFFLCGQFTKCTFFTPFTHTHAFYTHTLKARARCLRFVLFFLLILFFFCTHTFPHLFRRCCCWPYVYFFKFIYVYVYVIHTYADVWIYVG